MVHNTTWVDQLYSRRAISGIAEDLCQARRIGRDRVDRVLFHLAYYADAHAEVFHGQQAIADDLDIHRRDVRKALDILIEAKYIEATGRRGRATVYRLLPHNWGQR